MRESKLNGENNTEIGRGGGEEEEEEEKTFLHMEMTVLFL